uniref:Uncharacterized protein n=1 Tax=Arundo donax TaxID=35708 RepID=A0A0A9E239_ARUDO
MQPVFIMSYRAFLVSSSATAIAKRHMPIWQGFGVSFSGSKTALRSR